MDPAVRDVEQDRTSINDLSSINGSVAHHVSRPPVAPQEDTPVGYHQRSTVKRIPTPTVTPAVAVPSIRKQRSPSHTNQQSTVTQARGASPQATDWQQLNRAVKQHHFSRSVQHLAISSAVLSDDNWIWLCRVVPLLDSLTILDLSNTGITDERCKMLIGDLSAGNHIGNPGGSLGTVVQAGRNRRSHAGAGSPLYGLLRNGAMCLRTIDWSSNEIGSRAAASIGKLIRHFWHSLVFLNLRGNKINDHGAQLLGSHISSLYDIAERATEMTSLRSVDLSSNRLTARGVAEMVVQSTSSQSISNLVLSDNCRTRPVNALGHGSPTSPHGRSPSSTTSTSDVSYSSLSRSQVAGSVVPFIPRDLLHAMVCPNGIRTLNLSNCRLGPENGVELLRVILYSCTTLAELNLSNNDLDDAMSLEFVDTVRDLGFLTILDLSHNSGFTSETVKLLCHAISALKKMAHLQFLNLSHCTALTFEDVVNLVQLGVPEVREEAVGQFEAAARGNTDGLVVLPSVLNSLNTLDVTYTHLNIDECNVLHQVLRDNAGCTVRFGPPCDGTSRKIVTQHSPPSRTGVARKEVPHQVSPTPFQLAEEDEQVDPSLDTALDPAPPSQTLREEMLFEDDRSREIVEDLVIELSYVEEDRRRDLDDEEISQPPPATEEQVEVAPSLTCSPIKDGKSAGDVTCDEGDHENTFQQATSTEQPSASELPAEQEEAVQELAITVQEPTVVIQEPTTDEKKDEDPDDTTKDETPPPQEELVEEKKDEPKLSARERLKARREARSASRKRKFSYMWNYSEGHIVCRVLHLFHGERAEEMLRALEADLDAILHEGNYEEGQVGSILSSGEKRTEIDLSTIQLPTILTHTSESLGTLRERIRSASNDKFTHLQRLKESEGGDALYQLIHDRFTALHDDVGLESIDRLLHDSHGREDYVIAQLPPAPESIKPCDPSIPSEGNPEEEITNSSSSTSVAADDSADQPPPDALNSLVNESQDSSSGHNITTLLSADKIIIESNDTDWHLPDADSSNPGPAYAPTVTRCFPSSRMLDHGDVKIAQLIPLPPEAPEAAVASQNALNRSEMGSLSRSHSVINRDQGESIPNSSAVAATGEAPGWAQNLGARDAAAAAFNPSEEQKLQSYQSMLHSISQPSSGHATPLAESIHSQDNNHPLSLKSPSMMLERFVEKPKIVSTKPQVPPEKLVPFAETVEERKRAINAPSSSNPATPVLSRQGSIESVDNRRRIHAAQKRQNELKEAFAYAKTCLRNQQIDLPEQQRNKIRICQGKMGRIDLTVSVEWGKWLVIKNKIGMGAKDVLAMHPLLAVNQTVSSKPFVSEAPGNNLLITLVKPRHLVDEEIAREQDPSKSRRRTAFSQSETHVFQITLDKAADVTKAKEALLKAVTDATGQSPSTSPVASVSRRVPLPPPSQSATPDRSASAASRDPSNATPPVVGGMRSSSRSTSVQSSAVNRQNSSAGGGDPLTPQQRTESEVVGFTNQSDVDGAGDAHQPPLTPPSDGGSVTVNAYGQNAVVYGEGVPQPGYGYS